MSREPLNRDRVLHGLLIAPALPGLALELARGLHAVHGSPGNGILICIASYLFTLIVGLPALGIFELYGLRSLRAYLLGGFVTLSLLAFPFLTLDYGESWFTWQAAAYYAALAGVVGATVTATFWCIAVRPRAARPARARRPVRQPA